MPVPIDAHEPSRTPHAIVFHRTNATLWNRARIQKVTGFHRFPHPTASEHPSSKTSLQHCCASFSIGLNATLMISISAVNVRIVAVRHPQTDGTITFHSRGAPVGRTQTMTLSYAHKCPYVRLINPTSDSSSNFTRRGILGKSKTIHEFIPMSVLCVCLYRHSETEVSS